MTISNSTIDPGSRLSPRLHWKAVAAAAFAQQSDGAALRAKVAQRLRTLIGRDIDLERIWVDPSTAEAGVTVDGVRFRWEHDQLGVLRPCVHCGVGSFLSRPLHSLADIGDALGAWQPRHPECEPSDPPE
jgi:hypothetical protein